MSLKKIVKKSKVTLLIVMKVCINEIFIRNILYRNKGLGRNF